jgi:hypothetical protein
MPSLAKTKRLISYGETAHDPVQHHGGANLALGCSNNGFKSRLALRLIKTANATDTPFRKKAYAQETNTWVSEKGKRRP